MTGALRADLVPASADSPWQHGRWPCLAPEVKGHAHQITLQGTPKLAKQGQREGLLQAVSLSLFFVARRRSGNTIYPTRKSCPTEACAPARTYDTARQHHISREVTSYADVQSYLSHDVQAAHLLAPRIARHSTGSCQKPGGPWRILGRGARRGLGGAALVKVCLAGVLRARPPISFRLSI